MTSLSIFTSMTEPEKEKTHGMSLYLVMKILQMKLLPLEKVGLKNLNGILLEKYSKKDLTNLPKIGLLEWILIISFHEKDKDNLRNSLKKFDDYPAISFPQYQIFTPDRYQIKTRICIAFNKKNFQTLN